MLLRVSFQTLSGETCAAYIEEPVTIVKFEVSHTHTKPSFGNARLLKEVYFYRCSMGTRGLTSTVASLF